MWYKEAQCLHTFCIVCTFGIFLIFILFQNDLQPWTFLLPASPIGPRKRYGQPPVITFMEDGRLGNLMIEYATLWSIRRYKNVSVVMMPHMAYFLLPYFSALSIPVINPNTQCPCIKVCKKCFCKNCNRWTLVSYPKAIKKSDDFWTKLLRDSTHVLLSGKVFISISIFESIVIKSTVF